MDKTCIFNTVALTNYLYTAFTLLTVSYSSTCHSGNTGKYCTQLPMFNSIGEGHILIILIMIFIYNQKLSSDSLNIYD